MVPIGSESSEMNLDLHAVLEEAGFPPVSHTSVFSTPEDSDPQCFTASKELMVRVEDSCYAVILDASERDEAVNQPPSEEAGPSNLQSSLASECLMVTDADTSVMISDDSYHRSSLEVVSEGAGLPSISQAISEVTLTLTDRREPEPWLEHSPDVSTDDVICSSPVSSPNLRNLNSGCDEVLHRSSLEEAGLTLTPQMSGSAFRIPEKQSELIYRRTSAPELNSTESAHSDHEIIPPFKNAPDIKYQDSSHSEEKNNGLEMHMVGEDLMKSLSKDCKKIHLDDPGNAEIVNQLSHEEAGLPSISQANMSLSYLDKMIIGLEMMESLEDNSTAAILGNSECEEGLNASSLNEAGFSFISEDSVSSENILTGCKETLTLMDRSESVSQMDTSPDLDVICGFCFEHSPVLASMESSESKEIGFFPSPVPESSTSCRHEMASTANLGVTSKDQMDNCSTKCSPDPKNLEKTELSHSKIKNDGLQMNSDGEQHTVPLNNSAVEVSAVILEDSGNNEAVNWSPGLPSVLHNNTSSQLFASVDISKDQSETVLQLRNTSLSGVTSRDPVECRSSPDLRNLDFSHSERKNNGPEMSMEGEELMEPLARECRVIILNDDADGSYFKIFSRESGLPAMSQASIPDSDLIELQLNEDGEEHVIPLTDAGVSDYSVLNCLEEAGLPFISQTHVSDASKVLTSEETSIWTDKSTSKMFMDPIMDGCSCIQYCDSFRLQTEGVTSLITDQGQLSNIIISKENIMKSSLAIKDCDDEEISSGLSYANRFIPQSMRNEHTLDLGIDQIERQSNDLEELHFCTCSGKEFTAIPKKEQEVIYSDSSGYIDSCVMPSASKEPQSVTSSSAQGNVEDDSLGQLPGPLGSVIIAKFTQQVQHAVQANCEKDYAQEHEAGISQDAFCIQEMSEFKHSLHFDAHPVSDTNNNRKQHTPEPLGTLHSSAQQEVWNHSYPLRELHLNDFSNVSVTSAEPVMMDSKAATSNSLDVDDVSLEKMYEIECRLKENTDFMADPDLCTVTDGRHGPTCQISEISRALSLNGSGKSKTTTFCPDTLHFQSYPFIDVNTDIVSDLEPIMERAHPQENSDALDGEQKDLVSSAHEDECNLVQREENHGIFDVSLLKGYADKPGDVDVTTCLTNRYDGNEDIPNSASTDKAFICTNNKAVEVPTHSSTRSNSNFTGSIQILLKEKESKSMSAGKSSRFSRLTRIPSFRKSKREPKVGSKAEPEAKISPEVGEEMIRTPSHNPTVDHWTKYKDQTTDDVVGNVLGVTSNGQIKSTSSSNNTQKHDAYSEQVQIKPVPAPLKKSKSSDNFRTKLALAQRSLSSFFEIRIGEKDNQQDSTNLNQDSKSRQTQKKMKKSKEAEMLKRTLSLPGPHDAKSRRRLQSNFVSGVTEDFPDIHRLQSSEDHLRITSYPDVSVLGAETEPTRRKTLFNGLVPSMDICEAEQSYQNISGTLLHSTVSTLTHKPAPSWTRSLGSFEGLDTPTRPVTPKPQNPGVWSHRSSFRYPSKTVTTSLCSLGEGPSLEGLSNNSQRRAGQRTSRPVLAQSFDSNYLHEGTDNQSQTSLVSTNSACESEVSLFVLSVHVPDFLLPASNFYLFLAT